MIPKNIGRYEIKREIGRGGMAVVYHAHDPRFRRDVAIKVLPREFLYDPNFRGRFEREAQTIAALEHPAIVPVYDFGEEDGQPYLVMRYMSGGSLKDILQKGAMSFTEAAEILRQIAPALDKAHAKGIIHRDLKPANILFDTDGDPYLADFGIAKLTEAGTTLTGSGIIGTPAFMSPEQARGEKKIDGRSDVYALAVLLYQMLTGVLPYDADTPMGIAVKHIMEPIPDIMEVRPDLPPATGTVIVRGMAKNPDERYATAAELANALTILSGEIQVEKQTISDDLMEPVVDTDEIPGIPTQLPPEKTELLPNREPSPLPQPAREKDGALPSTKLRPKRARWVWAIGCLLLMGTVVVFGVVALVLRAANTTTQEYASESDPFLLTTANIGNLVERKILHGGTGSVNAVAWSPDGKRIASGGFNGLVFIWDAETGDGLFTLDAHKGAVNAIAWSPDSKRLASAGGDGNIYIWDGTRGSLIFTLVGHTDRIYTLEWSPDGKKLASGGADSLLRLWNPDTGNVVLTLQGEGSPIYDLTWSPSSRYIFSPYFKTSIQQLDVGTGESIKIVEGRGSPIVVLKNTLDGDRLASVDQTNTLLLWNLWVDEGEIIWEYHETYSTIHAVAWSPFATMLAIVGEDGIIRIWDVEKTEEIFRVSQKGGSIQDIVWSFDGTQIATANKDGSVRIWGLVGR